MVYICTWHARDAFFFSLASLATPRWFVLNNYGQLYKYNLKYRIIGGGGEGGGGGGGRGRVMFC